MKQKGWVVLTGGSSGIGRELSAMFARDNYNLVIIGRDAGALQDVARQLEETCGVKVFPLVKNLAVESSASDIFDFTRERGIEVDILVNNAGIQVYGLFHERQINDHMELLETNLMSLTRLVRFFLPGMVERGNGRILNIGSTGSFAPCPLNAVYCAAKGYVLSLSEALSEELKDTGVTVTALCPGATKTQFAKRAGIEDVRLFRSMVMDAEKVAASGYRGLMKGQRVVVPGIMNKTLVLSIRITPRSLLTRIGKFIMSK